MKKLKMIGMLFVMLFLVGILPTKAHAEGWVQEENGSWYYLNQAGEKAKETWIGNYYVDENGVWIEGKTQAKNEWISSGGRWWYRHSDGGYTRSGWEQINGTWYYFDGAGWMETGWLNVGGTWYYLNGSGAMATGWLKLGNTWYYLNGSGAMATGWVNVGGTWYYMNGSGAMVTGWLKLGNTWYYLNGSGAMATGWLNLGGTWYYLNGSGAMATGWLNLGGTWYYLNGSGAMATGWLNLGGPWYYLTGSGAMAANTWIGSYYVNGSGAWVPGQTTGTTTGGGSKNKIIAIDAGHQRKGNSAKEPIGPGASQTKPKVASGTHGNASGLNEYELTLQVSLKLRDELQARGYQVYMIRETHDVNISNAERAQMAANQGADILVRIHANGSDNTSVAGALTMAPSNSNPYLGKSVISASQTLSRKIVDCFCAATGAKNQGVMQTDTMSGINWSSIPVSIVEMGYMTNRTEDLNMASTSYQTKMVQGIANGIDAYYGA